MSEPNEKVAFTKLSPKFRDAASFADSQAFKFVAGMIPPDLQPAIRKLKASGLSAEGRDEIIALAESKFNELPEKERTNINLFWCLESAAKQWLERRDAQAPERSCTV